MFDLATRQKLRFSTSVGLLSTEDLWDLPLISDRNPNLDDLAKGLNRLLKLESDEVSFVNPAKDKTNETLKLAFEVVKHIIAVKVEERDTALLAKQRHDKKQQILQLINQKENEKLAGHSLEELQEMVTAL